MAHFTTKQATMAGLDIKKIDTNTPDMDYLLEIYGMSNSTFVSDSFVRPNESSHVCIAQLFSVKNCSV